MRQYYASRPTALNTVIPRNQMALLLLFSEEKKTRSQQTIHYKTRRQTDELFDYHSGDQTIKTYCSLSKTARVWQQDHLYSGNSSSVQTCHTNRSPLTVPLLKMSKALLALSKRVSPSTIRCLFGLIAPWATSVGSISVWRRSRKKSF